MSLTTLLNSEYLTLLSHRAVYSAEETGALQSVEEKARELDHVLTTATENIEKAASDAAQRGYDDGFEKGKAEGLKEAHMWAAENRLAEHHRVMLQDIQIKEKSVELALDIVRHIGLDLGQPESLHLLAAKVARTLRPDEAVKVRVHTKNISVVEELNNHTEISVLGDDSLKEGDCLLQWSDGRTVEADLETQLRVIKQHLLQSV